MKRYVLAQQALGQALGTVVLAALLLMAPPAPATANMVQDFYRGKVIKVVVGFDPGGGYDLYVRTITNYMGKYVPGHPTFVTQNMPGAGSRLAANWMYNVAPRDGSIIGMVSQATPMDQATKQNGVQFKAENFGWIGNSSIDTLVVISWAKSGIRTIEDVKTKGGLICGGSGGTSPGVIYPRILNALLKTDIRVISGYTGSSAYALAMERGELNCLGATSWSTAKASMGHFLKDHKIEILVQMGPKKEPEILTYAGRDVPLISDFAKTDIDRTALALITSAATVGRALFTPPAVPTDRLSALRHAFDATMKDADFLAEATKLQLNINPISGESLQQVVVTVTSASPGVLERVDELVSAQ